MKKQRMLLWVMILIIFAFAAGCRKAEPTPAAEPVVEETAAAEPEAPAEESAAEAPESEPQPTPTYDTGICEDCPNKELALRRYQREKIAKTEMAATQAAEQAN